MRRGEALLVVAMAAACRPPTREEVRGDGGTDAAEVALTHPAKPLLRNRAPYVPAACFAKTRDEAGHVRNPCYVCHTSSEAPNFVDDANLQRVLTFPTVVAKNPWRNLFAAPPAPSPLSDDEVLARVRRSNYFAEDGTIAVGAALGAPRGERFVPDAYYRFDDRGFDHRPDGTLSGWRAYAYFPLPGFFPTNGSAGDALIRLDPRLRRNGRGEPDRTVYEVNLAIAEALVVRANVAIDPVDETELGVDLDRNGRLGRAEVIVFDGKDEATRMQWVGEARGQASMPLSPGSLPLGTEFLHTVRYLDVRADGRVELAPRMREVRYAKKVRWVSYAIAQATATGDAREQAESADGTHDVAWDAEHGVYNRRGWVFSGYIEDGGGVLRPQTFEESAFCEGCHGGIGATVDSTFSFARKLGPETAGRGWRYDRLEGLVGLPDPPRTDGAREYETYLREARGADPLGANREAWETFFEDDGSPRQAAWTRLSRDVSLLLLPGRERALALDRASLALAASQSYALGRDPVLEPMSDGVFDEVPIGSATGIREAARETRLRRDPVHARR